MKNSSLKNYLYVNFLWNPFQDSQEEAKNQFPDV